MTTRAEDVDTTWSKGRPHDEPEDGWVTAPQLIDTELLAVTLCRFTGQAVPHSDRCPERGLNLHPDIECRSLFLQADALTSGTLKLGAFEEIPEEIRQPWTGGDQIGTGHAG